MSAATIGKLAKFGRQLALFILGPLAAVGLTMAAARRDDPFVRRRCAGVVGGAALGGLLLRYDTGVTSGALLSRGIGSSPAMQGIVVAIVLAGAAVPTNSTPRGCAPLLGHSRFNGVFSFAVGCLSIGQMGINCSTGDLFVQYLAWPPGL